MEDLNVDSAEGKRGRGGGDASMLYNNNSVERRVNIPVVKTSSAVYRSCKESRAMSKGMESARARSITKALVRPGRQKSATKHLVHSRLLLFLSMHHQSYDMPLPLKNEAIEVIGRYPMTHLASM